MSSEDSEKEQSYSSLVYIYWPALRIGGIGLVLFVGLVLRYFIVCDGM